MNPNHPTLLYCPRPHCGYRCHRPAEAHPDEQVLCPDHMGNCLPMTWELYARDLEAKVIYYQDMVRANAAHAVTAARRMLDAEQTAKELQERWDNRQFREDCIQEELEDLRGWRAGPLGAYACRMGRDAREMLLPDSEATVDLLDLHQQITAAVKKKNRLLVNQLAARAGMYGILLIEKHGDPNA